ncbi:hypothetical protein C0993_007869 [Termitomyces sp. T159_Od127]|nr:hypothetical protein C0993_007869 [Termitomyces sp. T159_Od127]
MAWEANCVASAGTNGVDLKASQTFSKTVTRRLAKGNIIDKSNSNAVGLPPQFIPTLPPVAGSEGVIKSYILPDNITGVVRCEVLKNPDQCPYSIDHKDVRWVIFR